MDEKTARELGYGRVLTWVDETLWIVRRAEYWDEHGERLKTVVVTEIERVDGIWTPLRTEADQEALWEALRRGDLQVAKM